jgi:tetratricopeptide (TPR) repeat protein
VLCLASLRSVTNGSLVIAFFCVVSMLSTAALCQSSNATKDQEAKKEYEAGDIQRAIITAQRALDDNMLRFGTNDPRTAISLVNLSILERKGAKYDQARAMVEQALAIFMKTEGALSPDFASALVVRANICRDVGDLPGAESSYREALSIRLKLLGPDHPDVADAFNGLVNVLTARGNYSEALNSYRKALSIYSESLDFPDIRTAHVLANLAKVSARTGNADSGSYYARNCLDMLSVILKKCDTIQPNGICEEASVLKKDVEDYVRH